MACTGVFTKISTLTKTIQQLVAVIWHAQENYSTASGSDMACAGVVTEISILTETIQQLMAMI